MDIPLRVLIVEDSDRDVALEVRALKAAGYQVTYAVAETAAEMKAALAEQAFDIVISDHNLPQFDAPGALAVLKQNGQDIPFIIVSGAIGEETAVSLIKAGAHDYVMKDRLPRLASAVGHALKDAENLNRRKQAEEELRESERCLIEAQRIGKIGNWEWIPAENKVIWSAEMYAIFGISPETVSLTTEMAIQAFHPEDRAMVAEATRKTLEELKPQPIEYRILKPDGIIGYVYGRGEAVLDANGKLVKVIGIYQDITERKRAEEEIKKYSADLIIKNEELRDMTQQLWQSAKLATMGELSASVAHELNNPLATVTLRIESLLAKVQAGSPIQRELVIIEEEVERMGMLVGNLLQFSRRGQPHISTLDVREEIEKTLELVYYHLRKSNITIEREFVKEVPHIQADRQQLRQLFLNLFTNASDAMPHGGTLTLRVTAPPESRKVIIEVADTGTGIAPDILPKVLEPFYTTKPEGRGTGLGLAICRRIAKEHGDRRAHV